jgi:hypothetical protein
MSFLNNKSIFPALIFSALIFFSYSARACNIPVFEYALLNWPSDPYEITLTYNAPLSADENEAAQILEKSASANSAYTNFKLNMVNGTPDEGNIPPPETGPPLLSVNYPQSAGPHKDVWSGKLSPDTVKAMLDSPVRRDISERLIKGDTVVWVLLESGYQAKDNNAAALLQKELLKLEKTLKLPEPLPGNNFDEADTAPPRNLKVKFSLIRIQRNQPGEEMFINMLLNSESDLASFSDPLAFPIYGRGRALYSLVGPGISEENIRDSCKFLLGPCSCQVKDLNPGIDLLMSVDWDKSLEESTLDYMRYADTAGLSSLTDNMSSGNLLRNVLITLALQILVVIIIISYIIIMRKKSI